MFKNDVIYRYIPNQYPKGKDYNPWMYYPNKKTDISSEYEYSSEEKIIIHGPDFPWWIHN